MLYIERKRLRRQVASVDSFVTRVRRQKYVRNVLRFDVPLLRRAATGRQENKMRRRVRVSWRNSSALSGERCRVVPVASLSRTHSRYVSFGARGRHKYQNGNHTRTMTMVRPTVTRYRRSFHRECPTRKCTAVLDVRSGFCRKGH